MGRYIKGILGSFQGKVGTVIGSTWRGISYMRSLAGKRTKPASQAQLEQQSKFRLLVKFISSLGKLLFTTFKDSAIEMTGSNSAFAYNFKNAITGVYPTFLLDYSKVLVSKGQLVNVADLSVTAIPGGDLRFDWADNSGIAMANATDRCIIVAYCPELSRAVYKMPGKLRTAKSDVLNAEVFSGKEVQTWIAFISDDGSEVSTSTYTGRITVS